MLNITHCFVFLSNHGKKLKLENATHPCPKCKRTDTVQLTRSESCFIIFNKKFTLPNGMRVRYECSKCRWKNENLPDDDPSFQAIPCLNEKDTIDYNHSRLDAISINSSLAPSLATNRHNTFYF